MSRDPRYDILFEPIRIGPKVAPNRFIQVPHCNGMGYAHPASLAAMRGVKAEGGWGIVSTEEVEIHPTTDFTPYKEGRLWDDRDMPAHQRVVEKIHEHGALAAIELTHNGHFAYNQYSREIPVAVTARPLANRTPIHARGMTRADIREYRNWHRAAALRAKRCGYDLVYVYCGHGYDIHQHFLSRRFNTRTDEYGGSLENRVRLLREVLESTLEAVGDQCAVPLRIAVDELVGDEGLTAAGEGREVIEMLAEVPDMWDVNIADWPNDSLTSRFADSGFQEPYIDFVKSLTTRPVVGVGRYTSPDAMVSLLRRGVMDLIGAARPSIADPFLPKKIDEGRIEDIRECIGCNICVASDTQGVLLRCTQNPTMGEEWRRNWHPERIEPRGSDSRVLVVGAGPAGLEAARALGQRGYDVVLAEASRQLGGRVTRESGLPGLSQWARVRDYREYQIGQMANVEVYLESALGASEVLEFGATQVAIATGARWRTDGTGRVHTRAVPLAGEVRVVTPDDLMDGVEISGNVLVFDDDHYYMGGIVAEKLQQQGASVTLVTPATDVSSYTHYTLEQHRIQKELLDAGVRLITAHRLLSADSGVARIACEYTGREQELEASTLMLVTAQSPVSALQDELEARREEWADHGIEQVRAIGDCYAPGTIAAAVWSGHRFAREVDATLPEGVPFQREIVELGTL